MHGSTTQSRAPRAAIVGLLVASLVPAAASAHSAGTLAARHLVGHLTLSSKAPRGDGTMSQATTLAITRGYLPSNEAAYRRAKAAANAQAATRVAARRAPAAALAPVQVSGFDGSVDPNSAPSDSTSNVGSTRFIELVNTKIAIYNKTSTVPLSTGTLNDLAGASGNAFDPQIMWDAQTNRFYYAMDVSVSATTNLVALGFSKTASPNNATTAFCHYNVNFGADLPDYPKLGDSQFFWIVGSNVFNSAEAFLGSDLFALSKPGSAAITTCPAVSSFKFGEGFNLHDPNGQQAFTPVPANEIDNNAVGYVTARTASLPSTRLSIHRVTRNATTGNPVFQMNGTAAVVPSYAVPPSAPQRSGFANSSTKIDTMDARPTQSVAAIDPAHNNAFGLWVQHTTATSPAGRSEVRWYEINAQPTTNAPLQRGKATNAAYFAFNGAISPDRARNGSTLRFGGNMVLGFDTSATTSFPAVRMLSKLGTSTQSGHVLVRSSAGNYGGFDCAGADNSCRWGDYAGASPDPIAATGATIGRVWSTSQYASGLNNSAQANWKTWNWIATP
jgi:hypothetical protein